MLQFIIALKIEIMRKIIILALTALMMIGCSKNRTQPRELHEMSTYIVDSCEYVGLAIGSRSGVLAHKGNCRFCAERRKQELQELVKQLKGK